MSKMKEHHADRLRDWERCVEIINAALGLGFNPDHCEACQAFAEIAGDFGTPTSDDLTDFSQLLGNLRGVSAAGDIAVEISVLTLSLYAEKTEDYD